MYLAFCDDEASGRASLAALLEAYRAEKLPSLRWASFQSPYALLAAVERERFDAVLLDILMPEMDGMRVARALRAVNASIDLVFLTSSPDYAVESYDVDASGYVLKPLRRSAVFAALDKIAARLEQAKNQGMIVKTTDGCIAKVVWKRLMYLEARGHHGVLCLAGGATLKTLQPFSAFAETLCAQDGFVQIHRSYIVNLHFVYKIEKNQVVLLDGTALPLPRSRYQSVAADFQRLLFGKVGGDE